MKMILQKTFSLLEHKLFTGSKHNLTLQAAILIIYHTIPHTFNRSCSFVFVYIFFFSKGKKENSSSMPSLCELFTQIHVKDIYMAFFKYLSFKRKNCMKNFYNFGQSLLHHIYAPNKIN